MAARRPRTVDPTKVTDLDSWLSYYKLGYANIKHGKNGELLVLDPATQDSANPAKVIEAQKAYDYIDVLRSESSEPSLRAASEAKREAVISEIQSHVTDAMANYLSAEKTMLEAVDRWNSAVNPAERSVAALDVGVAQRALADADAVYRNALFPKRYIKSESGIARKLIDYTTVDDRVIQYAIYRLVPEATEPADRVVIGAGTA
jgi:hypothetical protein